MLKLNATMALCANVLLFGTLSGQSAYAGAVDAQTKAAPAQERATIEIRRFLPDKPISRAKRSAPVSAIIVNTGDRDVVITANLVLPKGMYLLSTNAGQSLRLAGNDAEQILTWELEADAPMTADLQLQLAVNGTPAASLHESLTMRFYPAVEIRKPPYIPEPNPAPTTILVGAHNCPLWESDKPNMWQQILKHPERTPALGFYSQENIEVADWETKWAVEHGVSFFIYCWYRDGQGGPVKTRFASAIDARLKSKFADKMKFTIMWENQSRRRAGVADEKDLMQNLLPFWMENYFKNPSYLKVDNKPVLFIYRPEYLIDDLGGAANVAKALDKMRQACRAVGFDGLYILGEYRGTDARRLQLLKSLGLDYSFAYCWQIPNSPTPQQSIDIQMQNIRKTQELNILPQVVTVSQAWSGWADEGSIWKIPPVDFERLLHQAKDFIATLPKQELGSRMLILDNWNEWGEGHYIAPYREYGFGYLDAVRNVFSNAPREHEDLIPEDIGMGPYDTAVQTLLRRENELHSLMCRKIVRPGGSEGLVGWWTFDEEENCPVTFDSSGHRLGGALHNIRRAPGIAGGALLCDGGCVTIPANPLLSPTAAMSIECWVKTDVINQSDAWILNTIRRPSAGYRLGIENGKPSFGLPVTAWSHHLRASQPLTPGRWTHLAATFDGKTMRIYINGVECGAMDRPYPLKPNDAPLMIGNYAQDHAAHFSGLLDEVRLYDRALAPDEIRAHGQR